LKSEKFAFTFSCPTGCSTI